MKKRNKEALVWREGLFITGNRSGYGPDQVEDRTLTIGELISELETVARDYGDDTKVFLVNDNGYTYGEIGYGDMTYGEYDEDGNVEYVEFDY